MEKDIYTIFIEAKEESKELCDGLLYSTLEGRVIESEALGMNYIGILVVDKLKPSDIQTIIYPMEIYKDFLAEVYREYGYELNDVRTKKAIINYDFGRDPEELFKHLFSQNALDKMESGEMKLEFGGYKNIKKYNE